MRRLCNTNDRVDDNSEAMVEESILLIHSFDKEATRFDDEITTQA